MPFVSDQPLRSPLVARADMTQNMSCEPRTALSEFNLQTVPNGLHGTNISFTYTCAAAPEASGLIERFEGAWMNAADLVTLDPIQVACTRPNQALAGWGFSPSGGKTMADARLTWSCAEFGGALQCSPRATDWQVYEQELSYLSLHDAKCGAGWQLVQY